MRKKERRRTHHQSQREETLGPEIKMETELITLLELVIGNNTLDYQYYILFLTTNYQSTSD